MKKNSFIVVSQRIEYFKKNREFRDCLDQRLIKWLAGKNYISIPLPNNLIKFKKHYCDYKEIEKWLDKINPKAFLLSGGHDIGKFKNRDLTEVYILNWAIKKKKPLLGICRGMQVISAVFGSKLIKCENHIKTRHKIYFNKKKIKKTVNSFHAFTIDKCPKNFSILAKSSDGCIEAIKHNFLPIEGWMWHPEREKRFSKFDLKKLKKIFN